ncbi:hypothetical protein ACG02S_09630 [Roseateles sp. DC23W]|uniref:Uncharacterized protein n=1 Tax=Pelomonas dachongensis TaxID=3299029 RepID=A0ABW7EL36_9BURK
MTPLSPLPAAGGASSRADDLSDNVHPNSKKPPAGGFFRTHAILSP